MRCQAKSKQSGIQCKKHAMPGSTKCNMHGGKSLKGIESPTYKNGRYSKQNNGELVQRIQRVATNENYLNSGPEIELLIARVNEKLERIETVDSRQIHQSIMALCDKILMAIDDERYGQMQQSTRELRDIVNQRIYQLDVEDDIRRDLETLRRYKETQRKIQIDEQQMVSASELMNVLNLLMQSIRDNVDDTNALNRINTAFMMAIGTAKINSLDDGGA